MLEISDLHMVETISRTGSLTKASDELHVSQPTLSKRLARLETLLDTRLFQRDPTGLTPTLIANYLIESSEQIKANMKSVERQVERILKHDSGDLRVGVGPIIEQVLLPNVLAEFARQTGSVRLSVVTDRADILLDQLKAGQLDIIAGPFNADDIAHSEAGLNAINLIKEETINVVRDQHPILSDKKPDFFSYPYASPPIQGTMTGIQRPAVQERARVFADNYTLLKTLVMSSDYICGGPRYIFAKELKAGTLRVVTDSPTNAWQSACLMKSESLDTPLVKLFAEILTQERDIYLEHSTT